ncbi:hypothetical protein VTL71DRAFT_11666 [Oculimacula yallundae]|uniref:Uncharacterized protein n=1 Tax=Oculimacula yallundae TaxID=86028 RepID=A0ABR4CSJ6_9HELO
MFFSRQIRPPIYSMKQSKLRKRRVWRFAVLYFVMLIIALALLVGPIVAGSMILDNTKKMFEDPNKTYFLLQPVGYNNNDTRNATLTGTGNATAAAAATASETAGGARIRLF